MRPLNLIICAALALLWTGCSDGGGGNEATGSETSDESGAEGAETDAPDATQETGEDAPETGGETTGDEPSSTGGDGGCRVSADGAGAASGALLFLCLLAWIRSRRLSGSC